MIQFTYLPRPAWLIAAAVLILLALWVSYRTAKGRHTGLVRACLIALRVLAITAVTLCLLDPQWVEVVKHQAKSRVAILLDTSKSMSLRDVPGSRLELAKEYVSQKVLPVAPPGVALQTFSFAQALAALPDPGAAAPTGTATALADALEGILALPGEDPLTGVVLISDGIETSSKTPERVARAYRRKGIPIHTATVGTTNEMQDVILENVQVKRAVPNEAPTRLGLMVRSPGYANKTVTVQIRGEQKDIVATHEFRLNGGSQKVEIDLTPRRKGFQIYEAVITTQPGEWLATNNRRQFGLEVVDPTIRVIYMEGTPQQGGSPIPEWKYLKDALESDPNIKVKTLYRQVGNNGQFLNTIDVDTEKGHRIYPVEHPTQGFPRTLAGLLEYDVVIHSDIRKESFTPGQLQNIAQLVEAHGGGFIMIGGNSAFGKGGYHRTILDRIIPVAMEKENDSQTQAIKIAVPRAVVNHPIMNIGATRAETEAIWTEKFPRLQGFNRVDHAKPGAVVLGYHLGYQNTYGPGVLLAVQDIGKGRSMAFTSDTTRTWGRDFETIWGEPIRPGLPLTEANCDSRYYRQFWVNAIRWLANGKMAKTNNAVTLELAQSYCAPGETVAARVKVRDTSLQDVVNAQVSLLVTSEGRTNAPVLARYDSASRNYVADLRVGAASTCVVTAIAQLAGAKLGDDRQLLVCEASDLEMADLRARPEFMAALANDSGGSAFSVAGKDSASPAYVFANAPPPTVEYRRKPFWDKAVWLTLILALLGAEWTLRRAKGLA